MLDWTHWSSLGSHKTAWNKLTELDGEHKEWLLKRRYDLRPRTRSHNFWTLKLNPNNGVRPLVAQSPGGGDRGAESRWGSASSV